MSPNQISELVWGSEKEETGASSICIIYLGNRVLCTFRQRLKYHSFSYSFLDGLKNYVENLETPSWKRYRKR